MTMFLFYVNVAKIVLSLLNAFVNMSLNVRNGKVFLLQANKNKGNIFYIYTEIYCTDLGDTRLEIMNFQ